MQPRWNNILVVTLVVVVVWVLVRFGDPISRFIGAIAELGPRHDPGDRFVGMIAYTVVLVSIVTVIKILRNRNQP